MNLVGYDAAYNAVMIVTVYSIYPEGSRTWRMMLKAANEFLPWWNKPDGPALTVIHDGEKAASSAIKEHTLPNVHSFMDCRHMANNLLANVPRKGRSYRYRRSTIAGMQDCEGQGCTDSNRSLFLCRGGSLRAELIISFVLHRIHGIGSPRGFILFFALSVLPHSKSSWLQGLGDVRAGAGRSDGRRPQFILGRSAFSSIHKKSRTILTKLVRCDDRRV